MYYLETQTSPIITLEPEEFTNAAGNAVASSDFDRPPASRIAIGIWSLQSDPYPDLTQVVVTGATYQKLESFYRRIWTTRPLTSQEIAGRAADALATAQESKCGDINAKREALFALGLAVEGDVYQGKTAQLDQVSQDRLTAAGADAKLDLVAAQITQTPSTLSFGWIMADNDTIALTSAQMAAMADQCKLKVQQWVTNACNHKKAVRLLNTIAAVENYDFSGGW